MSYYLPGGFYPPDLTNPLALAAPVITAKLGTGAGNYTTTSTSYVDVDATNLAYTVTPSTGTKLLVMITGLMQNDVAGGGQSYLGLYDSSSNSILAQTVVNDNGNTVGIEYPAVITTVVVGDNKPHTLKLQFKAGAGGGTAHLHNSGGIIPSLIFWAGVSG